MRDFTRTKEPAGQDIASSDGNLFVVQRHRARRRHYDLRLELDGVLLSWAVPNGPTLDPKARRLAMRVEDHPLEYAAFEGIIPKGEYGGGDVIVWDTGTWQSTEDPAAALKAGNLHFDLKGEKLKGRFVLVQRGNDRSGKEQWLLLHKNDDYAHTGWDPEDHPHSVKSGRTNEEVAAAPEAMWRSDLPPAEAEIPIPAKGKRQKPRKRKRSSQLRKWTPPTTEELAALDELGAKGTWEVAGQALRLTNLNKVLFPARKGEAAVNKRDLIRYYASIAATMLPYLADRPLNMNRFPEGVTKSGFWQKEAPSHTPPWLQTWHYPDADPGEAQSYLVADSVASLAWLANYGAIELHPWTSRIDDIHRPTWVLFDIDPGPSTSFADVLVLARLHRTAFEHLGLEGRPKTSGQHGIQIWVPIEARYTYEETRNWAKTLSEAIGKTVPELISWTWRKDERQGRARLDYTQNVINKTLVAPYCVRAIPGAPVSVPLEWSELDDPELRPDGWTIRTVHDRLNGVGDPFVALLDIEQELPAL